MRINDYSIVFEDEQNNFILIQDSGTGISITNSAEEVIKDLYNKKDIQNGKKVYYIDTDGRVDVLAHRDGEFTGFMYGYSSYNEFKDHVLF